MLLPSATSPQASANRQALELQQAGAEAQRAQHAAAPAAGAAAAGQQLQQVLELCAWELNGQRTGMH
jgi:hypothetical protein